MADAQDEAQVPNSIRVAMIKKKVHTAFDKIGKTNGTAMPESSKNTEQIAWELFVARELSSVATKRAEVAKKAAQDAGILGEPPKPGDSLVSYEGDILSVSQKTNQPSETLDKTLLINELVKKYGREETMRIIELATKTNAPATTVLIAAR